MLCIGTGVERRRRAPHALRARVLLQVAGRNARAFRRAIPRPSTTPSRIAERCDLKIEFGKPKYPDYNPPEGYTQDQYLRALCEEGVRRRYGARADTPEIRERLERELAVLEKQGFVNYFLIVWDFIDWAQRARHPRRAGPRLGGRLDGRLRRWASPISTRSSYRLLFERFLNPERVSPPDIDVDFCQNRRGEVIDYVRQKYGERAVAQIITFGTHGREERGPRRGPRAWA